MSACVRINGTVVREQYIMCVMCVCVWSSCIRMARTFRVTYALTMDVRMWWLSTYHTFILLLLHA